MKLYYIAPRQTVLDQANTFDGSDWIDLDDTHVLVAIQFPHEAAELAWSQLTDVDPLPHPLSGQTITPGHVAKLTKHPALKVSPADRTFDVAQKAGAVCLALRLGVF